MGCKQTEQTSQRLEAMNWYFGLRECRSVTFVDDVASSLAGEEFDVNVIDENYAEKKYLVYLDDGIVSAPTPPAGTTLVAVNYSPNDDAATIASAFKTDMEAASVEVLIEVTGGVAEYQNKFLGAITAEGQGSAPSLTFMQDFAGFGGSIGQIDNGASLETANEFVDITSSTTGSLVLDRIYTGGTVSISLSLLEMTTERWKDLVGNVFGSNVTIGSEDLVGLGDDKLYRSAFEFAGELVGHPIRLGFDDRTADVKIPKTTPVLANISYSGDAVQAAEFTFDALRDTSKPNGLRLFIRGDHSLV